MSACLPVSVQLGKKKAKIDKNSIEYKMKKLDKKMTQTFQRVKKINKNAMQNELLEQELKEVIMNTCPRLKEEPEEKPKSR